MPSRWMPQTQLELGEAFSAAGGRLRAGDLRQNLEKIGKTIRSEATKPVEAFYQRARVAMAENVRSGSFIERFAEHATDEDLGRYLEIDPVLRDWPNHILGDPHWTKIESPIPGLADLPLTETWIYLRLRNVRAGSSDLDAEPSRLHEVLDERIFGEPLDDVLFGTRGLTGILGQPGAGKTTLVRWLARFLVTEEDCPFVVPVHVSLREFALALEGRPDLGLLQFFLEKRGVHDQRQLRLWERCRQQLAEAGAGAAARGVFFWLLDGWDEVPTRDSLQQRVLERIRDVAEFPGVVTSRPSALPFALPCERFFEILPLSRTLQKDLAESWLQEMERREAIPIVTETLDRNPSLRELASSPFLLTLLCRATDPHARWCGRGSR